MKQFKIFEHPHLRIEAVKQGWSWPAFFFPWIWALVKKMWGLGFGILGIYIFLNIVSYGSRDETLSGLISIAGIIASIVFGINGNKWRENNLRSRGFEYKSIITASNPETASALYVRNKSTAEETPPSDSWSDLSK